MKKRGRPKGYVMGKESRNKISQKLKGRKLTQEHRRKIAIAMIGNKNRVNKDKRTFIDDLYEEHVSDYSDEDVGAWIHKHREELLTSSGILSEYNMFSLGYMEVFVEDIASVLVDTRTPELILGLKSECKNIEDFYA